MAKDDISLETSLSPLWQFSWYSGLLFDWCRPMPNHSRLSIVARYTSITMVTFCFSFYLFINGVNLTVTAWQMNSIHEIMPFFITYVPIFLSAFIMVDYLIHRCNYLSFFNEWKQYEKEIQFSDFIRMKDRQNLKKLRIAIYGIYLFQVIIVISAFSYLLLFHNSNRQTKNAFGKITDHLGLTETLPFPILDLLQVLVIILAAFFVTMTELVSAFFYYHASMVLRALKRDVMHISVLGYPELTSDGIDEPPRILAVLEPQLIKKLHRIWFSYEKLRGLVAKADTLFGPSMILNHGLLFFCCCTVTYAVLRNFKLLVSDFEQTANLIVMTTIAFRFVSAIILISKLNSSAKKLRISAVHLQSRHWFSLQPSDHNVLQHLIKQLELDSMAACPSDFYRITPIILLHVSTLMISYIIVLLQSK